VARPIPDAAPVTATTFPLSSLVAARWIVGAIRPVVDRSEREVPGVSLAEWGTEAEVDGEKVTVFLCGDVMLGRGVDQILPYPGSPDLSESCIRDARRYVELAEAVNGPIPRPVDFAWPWGDVLAQLAPAAPDARVVNLETSVTRDGAFAPGKAVHYRMSPANLPCLAAVRPDVCVLANNHVLDFGEAGLTETLAALSGSGLATTGAGADVVEAHQPVAIPLAGGGRLLVFGLGLASSGIPPWWAATAARPGVALVPALTDAEADGIAARAAAARRPGDLVVVSLHWGSNWGYEVGEDQVRFAHRLVDGGVDLVHGHSSHHPRPVEVYRDRLVLHGCGDFVNDYEGISGFEEYRDDLRLAYLASLDSGTGALRSLRLVPLRARRMRLCRAGGEDTRWLADLLDRIGRPFGAGFRVDAAGCLVLRRM
jgi:poly-gamma-glutamate synthesis protein (capsule biosynthesis protein)